MDQILQNKIGELIKLFDSSQIIKVLDYYKKNIDSDKKELISARKKLSILSDEKICK